MLEVEIDCIHSTTVLVARHEHCDKGVDDGGAEDAFNSAIGFGDAALGIEAVEQTVHFVHTRGEDAEGDSGGEDLKCA